MIFSGILLVPLNKKAVSSAAKMFEKRKTTKFYLALVRGYLNQEKPFEINIPIGKDNRPEFRKLRTCTPKSENCIEPRNAVTKCVLLERGHIKGKGLIFFYWTDFLKKKLTCGLPIIYPLKQKDVSE